MAYFEKSLIDRNTFGMLVLQDFEALRPNLLARTIETVQGGGMICVLLKTMSSLKQLYTLTMVIYSVTSTYPRTSIHDIVRTLTTMLSLGSMNVSCYLWEHVPHVL